MRKLLLALMSFVLTSAILADDLKPLVLRFDNPSERSMSSHRNGPWFPDAGKNAFGLSVAHVWGGKTYTGRLHYSFPTPGHDAVILAGPGVFVPTEYTWACWPVYGDGSGHTIDLSVNDAGRENHYISPVNGNRIAWKGWKVLWFDLRRRPMVGWSGNNAQILEPPLNAGALVMCDAPESFVGEGRIWLGDITFMTDEMKAESERRTKEMEEASTQLDTIGEFRVGCPELSGVSIGNFNWESFQNQAAEIDTFMTMEGQAPKEPMRAWLAKSGGRLFIVCECETADIVKVAPARRQRDENVYEDECVEVFLDPSRDGSKYYHLAVNAEGIVGDEAGGGNGLDRGWNCDVKALVRKGEKSWSVALSIPLNAVGLKDATGQTVGFN
ncbi:MAG: hypothetical protein HY318_06880, partial [Armatimonadetes bacterium]|nr:hypothetical protein [Armatimonadota bacterium]